VRDCADGLPCGEGYLCDGATHRCVAAPPLTGDAKGACLGELLNYALQAGDGYTAYGNYSGVAVTGFLHRVVRADSRDATDHYPCVDELDLTTDPVERARLVLKQGRIPLLPPVCANDPSAQWPPEPNPCRVEGTLPCPDGVCEQYTFTDAAGADATFQDGRAVKVYYANPIINVGFLVGRLDDAGGLIVNPPPSTNYNIQVEVAGWYQSYGASLGSYLPETLVTAPDGFVYVVDSGLDSTSSGLRGQLLRIDPVTSAIDSNFVVR
jgi:hypothetical protein